VTYLALDLGAAEVTAAVWAPDGLVSVARAALPETQDARSWWDGVEAAVGGLDADLVAVEAVGCAGTAGTYLLLGRDGEPLGPAVLAGRGSGDAGVAERAGGAEAVRQRTGVLLDAASVPATLAAADLSRAGWVASGRDFVASLLTGRLASDPTAASATGFFRTDGTLDDAVVRAAGIDPEWLPPQRGSTEVLGDLLLPPARRLGLRSRIPVVTGATSEVCAVEGAGALPVAPLVTYGPQGTSGPLVVRVPVEPPVPALPEGVGLRAGGRSYQVYEASAVDRDGVARLVALLAPDAKFLYALGPPDRALAEAVGLPVARRREPVTLGLAMLTATGVGAHLDRDAASPVTVDEP
jgi:sugar (pentulose or hexulose) kinase